MGVNSNTIWKSVAICAICFIIFTRFSSQIRKEIQPLTGYVISNDDKRHLTNYAISNVKPFDEWLNSSGQYFQRLTQKLKEKRIWIEGHIFTVGFKGEFQRRPQLEAYYTYITRNIKDINRVCEIGFNGGHSALMWALLFKGEIVSFDLCKSKSCDIAMEIIKELLPDSKIRLIRGDSTKSVPNFHKENPDIKCDFLSVDGGHVGQVPRKDLENMKLLAAKKHVVVMDDVNSKSGINWIKTPGIAWEKAVEHKLVCPIDTCKSVFTVPNKRFPLNYCFGWYC